MSDTTDWHSRIAAYVGAIAGLLGLLIALSAYCHDVSESESRRETLVELDARVYWDSVYLGPFEMEPSNPYPRPEDIWPWGGGYYYGFEVYVAVSIYNDSEHPISVTRISCLHSVNQMCTGGGAFPYKYCFAADLVTPIEFPRYLLPQEQLLAYVRIDWPVIEEVVDIFTGIPYKHYDHQQIMELYNSRAPVRYSGGGNEMYLGDLFISRFCPLLLDGSSSKHRVLVAAHLAKGEQYHKILEF